MISLRKKRPNTDNFSGPYFPVFGLNTGKYGQEETPYLDTFHEVFRFDIVFNFFVNAQFKEGIGFSKLSKENNETLKLFQLVKKQRISVLFLM